MAAFRKPAVVMEKIRALFLRQLPELGNLMSTASDVEKRLAAQITFWPCGSLLRIRETESACIRKKLRCHDFTAQYVRVLPKRGRPYDPLEN